MLSQGNALMGHLDKMDSVKYSMALLWSHESLCTIPPDMYSNTFILIGTGQEKVRGENLHGKRESQGIFFPARFYDLYVESGKIDVFRKSQEKLK